MSKPIFYIIFISLSLCSHVALAQQSFVIAGGDISSSSGSISNSVGQPIFSYYSISDFTISEGVQQPYEALTLSINTDELQSDFSVYPVPTSNILNIKITNFNSKNLKLEIVDLQGKLLMSKAIESINTQLDLTNLEESVYFLSFFDQGELIRTQKIIKF